MIVLGQVLDLSDGFNSDPRHFFISSPAKPYLWESEVSGRSAPFERPQPPKSCGSPKLWPTLKSWH